MAKRPRPTSRNTPPAAADGRANASLRSRVRTSERRAGRCDVKWRTAVQELEVYKEEVRHQTDELLSTQHALEASRDRYAALYDFAPVAYLTLDRSGLIEELNVTAATLLNAVRARVMGMPFLTFVAGPDRRAYLKHLLHCRRDGGHVTSELHVVPRGGKPLPVMLSTWATPAALARASAETAPAPVELRTALLDLSDRRRAERQEAAYQQRLRSLTSELALAEERERRRIAVEIHDQISQSLAMAKMKLDAAASQAVVPAVKKAVVDVAAIVAEVLGHTRSLTFELSPPVLHELGFEPALEWLAERAQQQYGIPVRVDAPARSVGLPHETAVLLFQATRELIVNVVKHADAAGVVVRLRRSGARVQLAVEDDGRGFRDGGQAQASGRASRNGDNTGFGLFSIRTRLEHLGGNVEIHSNPGEGSRVILTVPLDGRSEGGHVPAGHDSAPRDGDADGDGDGDGDGVALHKIGAAPPARRRLRKSGT